MILFRHSVRTLFNFLYEYAVYVLFGTDILFPFRHSYILTSYFIGAFSDLYIGSGAKRPVYDFNRDGKLFSIRAIRVTV
jgi:hypothetical protein